jgi:HK97 family phage prohead protease
VYGVEDLGGDVINKGAFKKTIQERPEVPILWQHDQREVIGKGAVSEYQGKLILKARLDMEDPTAQKAYRKMKEKFISGLSIGFSAIKSGWKDIEGRMVREIDEAKLWEVSVVTFPMLPLAQVTAVKAAEDFTARIAALETENKALKAEIDTLKGAVQAEPAATKQPTEPAVDHSGATRLLSEIRASLKGL